MAKEMSDQLGKASRLGSHSNGKKKWSRKNVDCKYTYLFCSEKRKKRKKWGWGKRLSNSHEKGQEHSRCDWNAASGGSLPFPPPCEEKTMNTVLKHSSTGTVSPEVLDLNTLNKLF